MKPYSLGSGACAGEVHDARPCRAASSASFVASSEPSASPSGFSWVVTRKRSCARIASATACEVTRALSSGASSSISCVMRTPRSTVGSYSKVSCGVRFSRSSRREPRLEDAVRGRRAPASVRLALPLRAEHADVDASPGGGRARLDAGDGDEADARILQLADRLREHLAHAPRYAAHPRFTHRASPPRRSTPRELELLAGEVALRAVEQPLDLAVLARDAGERQPRALPELVVVDLGHRGAEAVLELRLRRLARTCACPSASRLREVQLDGEDADVAGAHGLVGGARRGARRRRRRAIGALDLARLVGPRGRRLPSRR